MTDTNVTRIEVWSTSSGDRTSWFWHAKAGNGEVVAQGEGHTRRRDAVRAAHAVFPGAPVRDRA